MTPITPDPTGRGHRQVLRGDSNTDPEGGQARLCVGGLPADAGQATQHVR